MGERNEAINDGALFEGQRTVSLKGHCFKELVSVYR